MSPTTSARRNAMHNNTRFVQSLESRSMLSRVAAHGGMLSSADSATIAADRQQLEADLLRLKNDRAAGQQQRAADRDAMKQICKSIENMVAPLRQKLDADRKAMN